MVNAKWDEFLTSCRVRGLSSELVCLLPLTWNGSRLDLVLSRKAKPAWLVGFAGDRIGADFSHVLKRRREFDLEFKV